MAQSGTNKIVFHPWVHTIFFYEVLSVDKAVRPAVRTPLDNISWLIYHQTTSCSHLGDTV